MMLITPREGYNIIWLEEGDDRIDKIVEAANQYIDESEAATS